MDIENTVSAPESLVERIVSGDKNAEQEIVEKYWKSLFYIVNKQANDPQLAQDITQEAFIVVIAKARQNKIEKPESISAYIRQVGVNLLIAHYRKDTRQKTDTSEFITLQFPDPSASINQKLGNKQLATIVKQVLDELPTKRDKDLLYRYFVYGQSKNIICDELNLSAEHFDRVLYRARSRLKQVLQVKLGVEATKFGISHLLAIMLASYVPTKYVVEAEHTFFPVLLRENSMSQHFNSIAVTDRPSNQLDSEQFQQKTRWQANG